MLQYVLLKLGRALIVVWGAFTASFILLYIMPANPVELLFPPEARASVTPAELNQISAEYGFNQPVVEQYLHRLLGYSVEEILRTPMREFIDPKFRNEFDAYLREIERTGVAHGQLRLVTRSGEKRIWQFHNTLRTEGVPEPIVKVVHFS